MAAAGTGTGTGAQAQARTGQRRQTGAPKAKGTTKPKGRTKGTKAARRLPNYAGGLLAYYGVLSGVLVLIILSGIMAFSASSGEEVIKQVAQNAETLAQQGQESVARLDVRPFISGFRQLASMVLGIVAAAVISRFDYHKLGKIAEVFAWVLWALLLLLLLFGDRVLGSTRWVEFPFFSFQPSEFIKPVLLVVMASFCAGYKERSATSSRKRNTNEGLPGWLREKEPVRVALLVAGAIVFIVWEPDLGSAVILSVGMTVAYILCGWSWYMPVFASICAALILAVKVSISHGYESGRVSDFFAKWLDGKTSHQILQAEYALGSGGVTGLGPGLSRQKYHYLPEAQNDFILAIIGEELGLSGTMAVIGAFILILLGGIAIAARARDRLGRALAGGATVMLVFQAVLNISAVTSLLPVTGKPLPFVTLGGSSMLSSFLLVGLILSVARFGAGAGASRAASRPAAAAADSTPRRKRSGAAAGTGAAGTTDARRRRRKSARKGAGSSARRPAASEHSGEVDDDEDDFDWGWDCRPRVPRTRRRD